MPEWGPWKAGSDGDDVGPVGCGGAAEPKLLLRKLPIKDEAGEFPINPLPAGAQKKERPCQCTGGQMMLSNLPIIVHAQF